MRTASPPNVPPSIAPRGLVGDLGSGSEMRVSEEVVGCWSWFVGDGVRVITSVERLASLLLLLSLFEVADPDGITVNIVVTLDSPDTVSVSAEEREEIRETEDLDVVDEVFASGGGTADPPAYIICSDSCEFIPS